MFYLCRKFKREFSYSCYEYSIELFELVGTTWYCRILHFDFIC